MADQTEGWTLTVVNHGKYLKVKAPVKNWEPFFPGHLLGITWSGDWLNISSNPKGVKLSLTVSEKHATLTVSMAKVGIMVEKAFLSFESEEINNQEEGAIKLWCNRIGLKEFTQPFKPEKPKAPKIPFKFNGTITGELPKAIGVINRAVDSALVSLDIDDKGKLVVAASMIIEGEG